MNRLRRLDDWVLKQVQHWVADPLQFSGVSIPVQCTALNVLATIASIARVCFEVYHRDYVGAAISGILVLIYVFSTVYRPMLRSDLFTRSTLLVMNGSNTLSMLVHLIVSSGLKPEWICTSILIAVLLLVVYLAICTPKPPRSIKQPELAFEN